MKKLFTFLALVLGLVSCQTEPEGFDVNVGGEQDVNITVSLPDETRAASNQGFDFTNFVDNNQYDLRFILEISYNGKVVREVKTTETTSATFPVRLAPNKDYTFTVWADLVNEGSQDDLYYNTANGLDKIEIQNWKPNVEARDAYTLSKTINFNAAADLSMELKRPFAKVRVVATDIEDIRKFGLEPDNAIVSYAAGMCESFNAVTGEAGAATTTAKAIDYNIVKEAYTDAANQLTVFADYILVPASGTVQFSLDIKDGAETIKLNNFNTAIPVERNKVTSIVGDVLTEGGNVNITINGTLEEKETITLVDTAASLQEVIAGIEDGGSANIELGGDIDLGDLFGAGILSTRAAATLPIVIAEGKTLVLDLNGFNITTPFVEGSTTNHTYAFENYGSLTIQDSKGNGQIIARGIFNYGTMTLKSGTINACDGNGGYGVRNYEGAEFVMNGGSIVTSYEDGDTPGNGYDASPVRVDEGATATINGGDINNVSNYTVAIDNYGTTTINDGTFTTIHTTIANSATMTINGGSFTCDGLEGVTAHAFWAAAGTTTINGGTFNGKDNYNGFNVDASKGAVVNINGGKFLPVHSGSLYGEGTINVKGGTFFDDPSLRVVKGYVAEKNGDVFEVSQIALEAKFADNSWDKIILACQNDIVPETWAVGNKKEMTIDGKTYEIAIIGKNHDTYTGGDTKAPLTFQLFQLYGTAAKMNETQDNTTGWSGSKMRNTTMADILNVMPDAVKNAIKAVDKVSLNGSKSALETTSDKLFLLSEIEVNGSHYYSGGYDEGSRYAYYADQIMDSKGNIISQIMKLNGKAASWYLRTPKNNKDEDTRFVIINASGYMTDSTADLAQGVVFGFCF